MTATAFVDWGLLGRVVVVAVLAGVGVVVVFSLGLVALSLARSPRAAALRGVATSGVVVAGGALVWALWWGFLLITNKG